MGLAIAVPRYTIEDLDGFPENGNRYEILDGVLLVTPAPRRMHDLVIARLTSHFIFAIGPSERAIIFTHGAIQLPPKTQLHTDLLVQPIQFERETEWSNVDDHWLAVEVLSRTSRTYDRDMKCPAYFALGVRVVWLVDLDDESVEVWTSPTKSETVRDVLLWRVPESEMQVRIDLAKLFAGV
ncbi:MAG: Uma2 family endonuclease [Gemmatimonadaceae bacterium]